MIRKIIKIDTEKCNGCGICAKACHEGAIIIKDGKAELLREDYCDGLGDCLPACPVNAISFENRKALPYDEAAVKAHMTKKAAAVTSGCPGLKAQLLKQMEAANQTDSAEIVSELRQWPVQIKLAPLTSAYFDGADLLIAADCTAFSFGDFHRHFIRGHITLIGCPKLDSVDYSEKLTEIIACNEIKSITVVRMEVPCCGGLEFAVKQAAANSGKMLPLEVVTISTDGKIIG